MTICRGIAAHGSGRFQVIAKVLAQVDQAARVGVTEIVRPERANGLMGQLPPSLHGARVNQGAPGVERPSLRLRRSPLEIGEF